MHCQRLVHKYVTLSEQIPSASSGVYHQHQLQYKTQQPAPSRAYPQRSLSTPPGSVSYTPFRTIKYPITYSKYAVTDHIDIVTVSKSFAAMAWHCRSNTVALPYHNMAASCWRLVAFLARRSTRVALEIRAQIVTVDHNLKSQVRENFPGYCCSKACTFPVF